jgi:hypothetical protein
MEGLSEDELRGQVLSFLKDFKELMGQGHYYVKEHFKNIHPSEHPLKYPFRR